MNDINQVQGVAVVFSILFSTVWNIALSANVAFGLNPSLMVLFLGLIPIEILITGRKGNFERRWIQALNNRMGKHYQVMTEILDKVKHIKVFNGVHAALQQFSNSLQVHHPFSFPALFSFCSVHIFHAFASPPAAQPSHYCLHVLRNKLRFRSHPVAISKRLSVFSYVPAPSPPAL
jgi:hypothetical protein